MASTRASLNNAYKKYQKYKESEISSVDDAYSSYKDTHTYSFSTGDSNYREATEKKARQQAIELAKNNGKVNAGNDATTENTKPVNTKATGINIMSKVGGADTSMPNIDSDTFKSGIDSIKSNLRNAYMKATGQETETNEEYLKKQQAKVDSYSDDIKDLASEYLELRKEKETLTKTSTMGGSFGTIASSPKEMERYNTKLEEVKGKLNQAGITDDAEIEDLVDAISWVNNANRREETRKELKEATNTGNAGKTLANQAGLTTLDVVSSGFSSFAGAAEIGLNYLQGKRTDTNSDNFYLFNTMNDYEAVNQENNSEYWEKKTGKEDSWQETLANFTYSAGMATAKSLVGAVEGNMVTSGMGLTGKAATAVGNAIVLPQFGSQAFVSTYQEMKDRGISDENALKTAFVSGLAEMGTEVFSLDKLWDVYKNSGSEFAKKAIVNAIATAGIEGSEEAASDVINELADIMINGNLSDYATNVEEYMAQGMSREEAEAQATKDFWKNTGYDFLLGSASGGMSGLVATGAGVHNNLRTGKYANNNTEATVNAISDDRADFNTQEEYERAQQATLDTIDAENKKLSLKDRYKLGKSVNEALVSQYEASGKIKNKEQLIDRIKDADVESLANIREATESTGDKEVAQAIAVRKAALRAEGYTDEDFNNVVTANQAFNKGKYGQEVDTEKLSDKAKEAYELGKIERTKNIGSDLTKIDTTKARVNNKTVDIKGVSIENGESYIETSEGKLKADEVTFTDKGSDVYTNDRVGILSYENEDLANLAVEAQQSSAHGINAANLKMALTTFDTLGRTGVSFSDALSGYGYMEKVVGRNILQKAFNLHANESQSFDEGKAIVKSAKRGKGLITDSKSENYDSQFVNIERKNGHFEKAEGINEEAKEAFEALPEYQKRFLEAFAKKTGIGYEFFTGNLNKGDLKGQYVPEEGIMRLNLNNPNIFQTALHEGVGEFLQAHNKKGYEKISTMLLNYWAKNNSDELAKRIRKYQKAYGNKYRESANELVNDTLAEIFTNEKAMRDMAAWMATNESKANVKTIKQVITDYIQTIKDIIADIKNLKKQGLTYDSRLKFTDEECDKLMKAITTAMDEGIASRDRVASENAIQSAETILRQSKNITDEHIAEIEENKQAIFQNGILDSVTEDFAKDKQGRINKAVYAYLDSIRTVTNKRYGTIRLSHNGVKHTISKGLNQYNSKGFKTIKSVLEGGLLVDHEQNWKGRGYDTYIVAGLVEINNKECLQGVVIADKSTEKDDYLFDIQDVIVLDAEILKNSDVSNTRTVGSNNESVTVVNTSELVYKLIQIAQNVNREQTSRNSISTDYERYLPVAEKLAALYSDFDYYDYFDASYQSSDIAIDMAMQLANGDYSILDNLDEIYDDLEEDGQKLADEIREELEADRKNASRNSISVEEDYKSFIDEIYNDESITFTFDERFKDLILDNNKQQLETFLQRGYYKSFVTLLAEQTKYTEDELWERLQIFTFSTDGIANKDGKTYANIHELSEKNLLKAIDLNGLAAPSMAIVDVDNPTSNYGSITLVFPADVINPETDPTFYGDAYSSSFPPVANFINSQRIWQDYGEFLGEDATRQLVLDLCDYSWYEETQRTASRLYGVSRTMGELVDNYEFGNILAEVEKNYKPEEMIHRDFIKSFVEQYFTSKKLYDEYEQNFTSYDLEEATRIISKNGDNDFGASRGERVKDIAELTSTAKRSMLKGEEGFYESKPQRIIYIDEAKYAIIPSDASEKLKSLLEDYGINLISYDNKRLNKIEAVKQVLSNDSSMRYSLEITSHTSTEDIVDWLMLDENGDLAEEYNEIAYARFIDKIGHNKIDAIKGLRRKNVSMSTKIALNSTDELLAERKQIRRQITHSLKQIYNVALEIKKDLGFSLDEYRINRSKHLEEYSSMMGKGIYDGKNYSPKHPFDFNAIPSSSANDIILIDELVAMENDIANQLQNANRYRQEFIEIGLAVSSNHFAYFEQIDLDEARVLAFASIDEINEWGQRYDKQSRRTYNRWLESYGFFEKRSDSNSLIPENREEYAGTDGLYVQGTSDKTSYTKESNGNNAKRPTENITKASIEVDDRYEIKLGDASPYADSISEMYVISSIFSRAKNAVRSTNINDQAVWKLGQQIYKEYKVEGLDEDAFCWDVLQFFGYLQFNDDVNYDTMMNYLLNVADEVLSHSKNLDAMSVENEAAYKRIIGGHGAVRVTDAQKKELTYYYDTWKQARNELLKAGVKISDEGSLTDDGYYSELVSEIYNETGYRMDAEATDVTQLLEIIDASKALKARPISDMHGNNMDLALELSVNIIERYFNLAEANIEKSVVEGTEEGKKAISKYKKQLREQVNSYKKTVNEAYDKQVKVYEQQLKDLQRESESARRTAAKLSKDARVQSVETARRVAKSWQDKALELKDENIKKTAELKAQVAKESVTAFRDAESKKKSMENITKTSQRLVKMFENPTDKRHVPDIAKPAVAAMINAIDFIPKTRVKRLTGDGIKEAYSIHWIHDGKSYQHTFDHKPSTSEINEVKLRESGYSSKTAKAWVDQMRVVKDYLASLSNPDADSKQSNDAYKLSWTIEANALMSKLDDILKRNEKTNKMSDISSQDLKAISDIMSGIAASINKMNDTYANAQYKTGDALGNATLKELQKKKGLKKTVSDIEEKLRNFLNIQELEPISYFSELGDASKSIYDEFREGENTVIKRIKQSAEAAEDIKKRLDISNSEISQWSKKIHEVEITEGKVTLTTSQLMSLYALMKRDQARFHLMVGGFRVGQFSENGALRKTLHRRSDTFHLLNKDYNTLMNELNDKQKAAAIAFAEYLGTEVSSWGNNVSQQMYGYDKYTEDYYFPMHTDDTTNATTSTNSMVNDVSFRLLQNQGFTKATVEGASNPLVLDDFFTTFTDHIEGMAKYEGYVMPIADAMRWYNYQVKEIPQNEGSEYGVIRVGDSVKNELERTIGSKGRKYFEKLIADINNKPTTGGLEIQQSFIGRYKAQAVMANFRVVIQQPTAYIRAINTIDSKYLMKALKTNPKGLAERAQEHSPIAYYKANMGYDTMLGKTLSEMILGTSEVNLKNVLNGSESFEAYKSKLNDVEARRQYISDLAGNAAGKADDFTWGYLYKATELAIQDTKPELEIESEEYFKEVNKLFDKIIDETQVVDTLLSKSDVMRNSDTGAKLATAFMAEPTKTYNMLHRAFISRDKSIIKSALYVYALNAIGAAVAQSIADAWRDDDDETSWFEKFLAAFLPSKSDYAVLGFDTGNLVDSLNPFNLLPLVKEASSVLAGFDSTRLDTAWLSEVADTITSIKKYAQGKATTYGLLYQASKAYAAITGVPISNAMREVSTAWNNMCDIFSMDAKLYKSKSAKESAEKAKEDARISEVFDAMDLTSIKTEMNNIYEESYNASINDGKDENKAISQAWSKVRDTLKTQFKRQLEEQGDSTTLRNRYKVLLKSTKYKETGKDSYRVMTDKEIAEKIEDWSN